MGSSSLPSVKIVDEISIPNPEPLILSISLIDGYFLIIVW